MNIVHLTLFFLKIKHSFIVCKVKFAYLSIIVILNYFSSFLATTTSIDNGPDIYVGLSSKLKLVCRIDTAGIQLKYIIWRKADKVRYEHWLKGLLINKTTLLLF